MKLSVYVEGRIPAIVVPEGREVRLRIRDGQIEVLVGNDVIVARPGSVGAIAHVGVSDDAEPSDARVQQALDEEDVVPTLGAPVAGVSEQLADPAQIDLVPPLSGNPDAPTAAEGPET